ncbi:hypothetical protein ACLOJK_013742 [Asimina triloba]
MISIGIGAVHTSAMVSIGMSPPSLPFHTKPLSSVATLSRIASAPRFPSLKNRDKRNRVSCQASKELHDLGIEDTDELEEQILGETAPLVAFMKMILQPGRPHLEAGLSRMQIKTQHWTPGTLRIPEYLMQCFVIYKSAPSYADEHELNELPELLFAIGESIGYHPDFGRSRCLFVFQKDGKSLKEKHIGAF